MPADPFADLIRAVDPDGLAPSAPAPSPLPVPPVHALTCRKRPADRKPAVSWQTAFNRIRYMARKYGLTSADLHAIYALARIEELMQLHGITVDDLREPAAETAAVATPALSQGAVPITWCPTKGQDPRRTAAPGEACEGTFMADWRERRGDAL